MVLEPQLEGSQEGVEYAGYQPNGDAPVAMDEDQI